VKRSEAIAHSALNRGRCFRPPGCSFGVSGAGVTAAGAGGGNVVCREVISLIRGSGELHGLHEGLELVLVVAHDVLVAQQLEEPRLGTANHDNDKRSLLLAGNVEIRAVNAGHTNRPFLVTLGAANRPKTDLTAPAIDVEGPVAGHRLRVFLDG